MDLKIKNKKALVLGASSGLGKAVASGLIAEGVQVAVASRNLDKLQATAKEISAHTFFQVDLSQKNSGKNAIAEMTKKMGAPDILVINTGGPKRSNFETTSLDDWSDSYQSLWGSAIECIQGCLPNMIQNKWGRVLLVTSFAAKEAMPNLIISNAYRAGLLGLTKSLSNEYAQYGITVNSLLPGYTMTQRVLENSASLEKIAESVPAKRLGTPEEFASLACYLSSMQAAYITGQAIAVDGGYLKGI